MLRIWLGLNDACAAEEMSGAVWGKKVQRIAALKKKLVTTIRQELIDP
jgi:hypothetical protein